MDITLCHPLIFQTNTSAGLGTTPGTMSEQVAEASKGRSLRLSG